MYNYHVQELSPEQERAVIEAVRSAGARLLEYWPGSGLGGRPDLGVQSKADGSFVTNADFTSNTHIVSTLEQIFPADGILSEELPLDPLLSKKRRIWVLDPLDGTHPFIHGQRDFSILLALCIGGRPIFSIMFYPALDYLFLARKGQGASLGEKVLRVSEARQFRPNSIRVRGLALPPAPYLTDTTLDSGPSVIRLVNAEIDGVLLKSGKMGEWDIAAPSLVIEESGGLVSDEKGQPIQFGTGRIAFQYFVASNGFLHQQVLALTRTKTG